MGWTTRIHFSQMKTELIWEGKYDEYGNRRAVDIAICAVGMI
jgi:adenine-specific DNA-methyltransferase